MIEGWNDFQGRRRRGHSVGMRARRGRASDASEEYLIFAIAQRSPIGVPVAKGESPTEPARHDGGRVHYGQLAWANVASLDDLDLIAEADEHAGSGIGRMAQDLAISEAGLAQVEPVVAQTHVLESTVHGFQIAEFARIPGIGRAYGRKLHSPGADRGYVLRDGSHVVHVVSGWHFQTYGPLYAP